MHPAFDRPPYEHRSDHSGTGGEVVREQRDQEQIARLFESTGDLLATITPGGRFTLLNPAWEEVLGWTCEELLARSMRELLHPDDVEQTTAVMLTGRGHAAQLATLTNG